MLPALSALRTLILLPFLLFLSSLLLLPAAPGLAAESGCVACHTSGAKLIKLTRELAAARPELAPPPSEGEG